MQSRGKKTKIYDAAAKLFLTKGYQATSIADLAAGVGMLKGSLYYYIQSKDDLLCEVILAALQDVEASLIQDAPVSEDAESIQKRLKAHFAHISCNHIGLALLLREADQLTRARREVIKNRVDQYERLLAQTLRTGQCCGVVALGDPDMMAKVMIGASTWVSWADRDPGRQAAVNDGILQFFLSLAADDRARVNSQHGNFSSPEAAALAAGHAAGHLERSPGLT
jgi:AcrR family transcriptional regulator